MNFARFKELTRLEQTFFGLPYLFSGALLPFVDSTFSVKEWERLLWILPAFLAARLSGMAFNQLIDRYIDARNPRTQNRPLPKGRVTVMEALIVAWAGIGSFLLFCFLINSLCFFLGILSAFLIIIYSYLKKVHSLCHFILGLLHLLSPLMAFIAITGRVAWSPFLLGTAALCSVVANDILYAFQDYDFDCREGLYSIPARLGLKKSLWVSRLMHSSSIAALILMGVITSFSSVYFLAPLFIAVIFFRVQLHFLTYPQEREKLFFQANALSASTVFLGVLSGVLWDVMS